MSRNKKGRNISGVLLLDKDSGITSNKALQQVKRLFYAKKAGHTGSLDPLATGVLPICFGEATKFAKYLLADTKTYIATAKLGVVTNTLDSDGEVIKNFDFDHINKDLLNKTIKSFLGKSLQTPPMFSALKIGGVPLYKLAREDKEIKRDPREIEVFDIELLDFISDEFKIKVKVSKGTYIRSLIADIANKMQTGACIIKLRRVGFADFNINRCYKFSDLENSSLNENDAKLLKTDIILSQFSMIILNEEQYNNIQFGRKIHFDTIESGLVKMYYANNFIGLGEVRNSIVQPKRFIKITTKLNIV